MPTIYGSPVPFTVGAGPGTLTQAMTFVIPPGVYSSGQWEVDGTANFGAGDGGTASTASEGVQFTDPGAVGLPKSFSDSQAVTALQLADINAAAGSTLAVTFSVTIGSQDTINSLALVLTGGGGTTPTDPDDPVSGLPQPAPDGGIYLSDGTYLPGSTVCGAGYADKLTLLEWMRQGHV